VIPDCPVSTHKFHVTALAFAGVREGTVGKNQGFGYFVIPKTNDLEDYGLSHEQQDCLPDC
jgi:hypothetical protein